MADLVIYGDAMAELSAQVEALPKAGQDAIVNDFRLLHGGSAANCAVVSARLGSQVRYLGLLGQDPFGDMLMQDLEQHGVDITGLRQIPGPTGVTIALVDALGERTFLSFLRVAATDPYGTLPAQAI